VDSTDFVPDFPDLAAPVPALAGPKFGGDRRPESGSPFPTDCVATVTMKVRSDVSIY